MADNVEEGTPNYGLPADQVAPLSSGGTSSILNSKPVNFDFDKAYTSPTGGPNVEPAGVETITPQVNPDGGYAKQVKDRMKNSLRAVVSDSVDQFKYQKAYSYNPEADGARQNENFQRYYSHLSYNKLGFSPWKDNETLYNEQGSLTGDLWRATKSAGKLMATGFVSPLRSYADVFSDNPEKLDYLSEKEMRQANTIGSSTRGGVGGFTSNLLVNSGYTLGVGAEIVGEFLLSTALTPETGGGSLALTVGRAGKTMRDLFKVSAYAGKISEGINYLKNFDAAKTAYNSIKTVGKFVNPLEHTIEAVQAINKSKDLTTLAKVSKTAGGFYRDVIMANAVASEAKMEGASTYQDVRQSLLDKYYTEHGVAASGKDYEHILALSHEAGAETMKYNIPAIFLTNKITFGGMFGKFKNLESYVTKQGLEFGLTKTGFEVITPGIKSAAKGLLKPGTYGKAAANYFKGNLSEGLQESMQEVISGAAKDYYGRLYDNPSKQGMNYALSDVRGNLAKQFSGQGFETFASGFFMGGLLGGLGHVTRFGKEQALRVKDKAKYEEYKLLKQEAGKKQVDALNELYKDPLKYFGSNILKYSNTSLAEEGKTDAQAIGDNKAWQDWEDHGMWAHVTNALDTGTYDIFLDQLDSISKMDKKSIQDAYGVDGEEVLSKIDKIKERADSLKQNYDSWNDKYPNPYNPKKFEEGSLERRTEELAYNSWNSAKNVAIFYNHSYQRNAERVKSMINDVSSNSPVADALITDITPLMDARDLRKNKALLRQEIATLKGLPDKQAQKQRKQKQRKLELLKSYEEALVNHFAVESETSQAAEPSTLPAPNTQQRLKVAYEAYLKNLARQNQTSFIQKDADTAFTKIVDTHRLGIDNVNLTAAVNLLENPKGFYDFYDRLNKTQTDLFENREKDFEESVEKVQSRVELNSVLQALFSRGIVIPQNELDALANEKKAPNEFYDVASKQVITKLDPRYNQLAAITEAYVAVNTKGELVEEEEVVIEPIKSIQTANGLIRIIRHGETIEDEQGVNSGPTQEHITAEGAKHVEQGAEGNVDETLTKIIVSSRQRAKDSADVIAKGKDITIEENKALDPWNTGDEKTGFAEIPDEDWHKFADWFATHPEERVYTGEDAELKEKYPNRELIESFNDFKNRVLDAMPAITNAISDGGAIMTHSNVIQLLKAYVENGSKNDANINMLYVKNEASKNGEFIEFQRKEINPSFIEKKVVTPKEKALKTKVARTPQDIALAKIKTKLDSVNDEDELNTLIQDIESKIGREYTSDGVEDLINARKKELSLVVDWQEISEGDLLVHETYGKVQVMKKDPTYIQVKEFGLNGKKSFRIYKHDLNKDIKHKWREGMEGKEPINVTDSEKKLAQTNLEGNTNFMSDVALKTKLQAEVKVEGKEKVNKDFFNDLGCK